MEALTWSPAQFQTYVLMVARISSVLLTIPIFSNRAVPSFVKIGLALLTALILLPLQIGHQGNLPGELVPFLFLMFQEILVGVLIGFATQLVFLGLQAAGQVIGLQVGLNIASAIDPLSSAGQVSYIDQFYTILAALIFLGIDGHHWLLLGIQRSFAAVPVGTFVLGGGSLQVMIDLSTSLFTIALRIGLPVIATLLLTDIALTIVARLVPQMNILFVGMPAKFAIAIWVLMAALPLTTSVMRQQFEGLTPQVLTLLRAG